MPDIELTVASGAALSVIQFEAHEVISEPFSISVWARARDATLDLEAIAGLPASLQVTGAGTSGSLRMWSGVASYAELGRVQDPASGLTSYFFRLVPRLWLLTKRRGLRLYQHMTVPQIIDELLGEWSVDHAWTIDDGAYPSLELRTQWRETDFAFFSRLLEEAGITYAFDQQTSQLLLSDAPEQAPARDQSPVRWTEAEQSGIETTEYVRNTTIAHDVRPGRSTYRDTDFRRPAYPLFGEAQPAPAPETPYEQYVYQPGAFARDVPSDLQTPNADDRGAVRNDGAFGLTRAQRALDGERAGKRSVSFDANFIDIAPGTVFAIDQHPLPELNSGQALLVTELTTTGTATNPPAATGRASFASSPWRPRLATPKPRVRGVQVATVVGPTGEEIHTDEFGRVRVQFPWDREGGSDQKSSCWMRVSQGWGGVGYGMLTLPRVGQEVLVDFLDGDPDQPVVTGRLFNATAPVPYKLPENKTISTWKSDSSPGSGGYNEIQYEDRAGQELVYTQAERNQRKLVKNDETITVGEDRTKYVLVHETDTTGVNRVEVTVGPRTQVDGANRAVAVGGGRQRLVASDQTVVVEGPHQVLGASDRDAVLKGTRRERVEVEVHQVVLGDRREQIAGKQSISVGDDRHETVTGAALFSAGQSVGMGAGTSALLEGAHDLTLKGGGGFIRIDSGGVTIVGNVVQINAGGSAGDRAAPRPDVPDDARNAQVATPAMPVVPPLPAPPPGSSWIELSLASEDDPSVGLSFTRYRVSAPDGTVVDGRLDASGRARVMVSDPGACTVSFPDLDGGTWSG